MLAVSLLATMAQETTWWGYWHMGMPLQEASRLSLGSNNFCVRLTPSNSLLVDAKVHGLRFWISDKSAVQGVSVWMSSKKDATDMMTQEVPLSELKDVAHDQAPTVVTFSEAVSILPAGSRYATAYVGFTVTLASEATPCYVMAGGKEQSQAPNSCFIDGTDRYSAYGPLAMQMLVSGARLHANSLGVQPFGNVYALSSKATTAELAYVTQGTAPLSSFAYQLIYDGVEQPEYEYLLETPISEAGRELLLPVQFEATGAAKVMDCTVKVTKVNGQPNESDTPSATGTVTGLTQYPLKRSVMEEFTGTWCPNCPRGMVGIELLEEQFGNRFIAIAVHNDDPMEVAAYDKSAFTRGVVSRMGGRPSCAYDRTFEGDPYGGLTSVAHFGANLVVDYLLAQPTVADIDIQAHYDNDALTTVTLDAATTFRYSSDADGYQLMLVLTADSLTGDTEDWLQVNTLVGKTEYDSDLDFFVYGDRRMQLKYNHVPIWVEGVENGIEGSISLPLQADEVQHFLRTVDLSGNTLVQRKECLSAIAMLIHPASGRIVNVAKAPVTGAGQQAIHDIVGAGCDVVARYTSDGRACGVVASGRLVIERRSDGSVCKYICR